MKLKPIIPIVLMISAPIMGMGQNKSGLVMSNLDKTVKHFCALRMRFCCSLCSA